MWQLAVLIVTAYAADFDSLKWSEGSHPSVRKSIQGPVPEEFQEGLHASVDAHRQKRMVHGQDYQSPSSVPKYLVRIVRKNHASPTKLTWCTGTIIAPGFVLTAAWCVFDQPDAKWMKSVIPLFELEIRAGDWDMTNNTEASEQVGEPIQYHIHPRYKYSPVRNNLEFDIALIQLKTDFTYNDRVGEIEMWDKEMPSNLKEFLWFKMSGFGEAKTDADQSLNPMWSTTEGEQYFPRFQYYAWRSEGVENCKRNWKAGNPEYGYALPDSDRGKVCFFTGLLSEVPYRVGAGDWGAPITWYNHTEGKEYLMMYAPYEPLIRHYLKAVTTDEFDYRWAAKVAYYKDFITAAMTNVADDYYRELIATSTSQTESISLNLTDRGSLGLTKASFTSYNPDHAGVGLEEQMDFHNYMYIKEYTFFLTTPSSPEDKRYVNVDITYQPESQITTNTTIYVRDGTGGGEVLKHFSGKESKTLSVKGISNSMTIEVTLANYEWTIRNLTADLTDPALLNNITITVDYYSNGTVLSSTGQVCATSYLECEDKSFCVQPSAVCDLRYDCLDGKDETIWCLGAACKSSEYRCSTGECIPSWQLCDGTCDCAEKSQCEDESTIFTCTQANFNETFAKALLLNSTEEKIKNDSGTFGSSFVMLVTNILMVFMLL